jgi:hypothetical protein
VCGTATSFLPSTTAEYHWSSALKIPMKIKKKNYLVGRYACSLVDEIEIELDYSWNINMVRNIGQDVNSEPTAEGPAD